MTTTIDNDPLRDAFGRTLEQQLQDDIRFQWWHHQAQFHNLEYNTDTSHLDGDPLPHGVQLIYRDGGPQYSVERYLPKWHHEKAVELLDDSYESLLNYFTGDTMY